MGLIPASTTEDTDIVTNGFFPNAQGLETAMRLAAEQVVAEGTLLVGNISITIVEAATAATAVAGLCSALNESTMAVSYGLLLSTLTLKPIGIIWTLSIRLVLCTTVYAVYMSLPCYLLRLDA